MSDGVVPHWKLMSQNLISFSHLFGQLILLGISVPLFLSPLRLQGSETQVTRSGQIVFFPLLEHNFSFKLFIYT